MSISHIYTVQMCSGTHPAHNLKQLRELLETQTLMQPALVCLPESWLAFCETPQQTLVQAEESSIGSDKFNSFVGTLIFG